MLRIVRDGDQETVEVSGTAVFKSDKMVGELDLTEGRGLAWVLGTVKSGVIVVRDTGNAPVSIEIIRTKATVKPVLKDGKIAIRVDIFEEGNIGEDTGTKNLTKLSEVAFLENGIAEAIGNEITAAIGKARALDSDIFGFGEAIRGKYPRQWKEMEDNWDALFKTVEIDLSVDANLRLAGKIAGPLVPEKG
jgi:spore germination protein KC